MKILRLFIFLPLLLFLLNSCNKDLDVYAPYSSTTIIAGFLDPSVDTQFVRINRTWQGEGNNLDYALVRDSSEYKWDEFNSIIVEELQNGSVVNTWDLQEIERSDKDPNGIFFGPEYTAYFFVNDDWNDENTYRISIDFKDRVDVSAETDVITAEGGQVTTPNQNAPQNYTIKFADIFGDVVTYSDFNSKWNPYTNAFRYDGSLRMHYTEYIWQDTDHTILLEENEKILSWDLGTIKADAQLQNGKHVLKVNGESFYTFLQTQLEVSPFISRKLGTYQEDTQTNYVFDYVLNIANEDLNTFMEVNEPVTNIIQERPEYTNVNNGIGIFGSRVSVVLSGVGLKPNSVEELIMGQYTIGLNFCSADIFSDFFCD